MKVKNLLNNTLNVLNWYGKKVLDSKGNIDTEKLKLCEANIARGLVKQNQIIKKQNKNLPKDKKIEELIMDDVLPIKKFPQKDITIQKAMEYGFIGDLIQDKFVNKHK